MADPCTKSEVSSISRCGDITWGVKFQNGLFDPDHAPFREDFSSAGWDVLWYGMVNVDLYSAIITKVSNALEDSYGKPMYQI